MNNIEFENTGKQIVKGFLIPTANTKTHETDINLCPERIICFTLFRS